MRQFLFDVQSVLVWDALRQCSHGSLAGIAAKAFKESTYHRRHSSEWMLRLGDGTAESHQRAQRALDELWRFTGEMFAEDGVDAVARAQGIVVDRAAVQAQWRATVREVVERATLTVPADGVMASGGRTGRHTEFLGHLLAEMQIVARSDPGAKW